MAGARRAVSDAGPLIHLHQVNRLDAFKVVRTLFVTDEVVQELGPREPLPHNAKRAPTDPAHRDLTKLLSEKHRIGLGESSAISLCRQEGVRLLLTDDLEAREIAREYGLDPHGTLGLVTRAFRIGLLTRKEALDTIHDLRSKSSLFLTADLEIWAQKQIQSFRGR